MSAPRIERLLSRSFLIVGDDKYELTHEDLARLEMQAHAALMFDSWERPVAMALGQDE